MFKNITHCIILESQRSSSMAPSGWWNSRLRLKTSRSCGSKLHCRNMTYSIDNRGVKWWYRCHRGWVYIRPIMKVGYLLGLGNESDFVLGLNTAACELEFTIRLPCASLRLGVLSHAKNIKVNMTLVWDWAANNHNIDGIMIKLCKNYTHIHNFLSNFIIQGCFWGLTSWEGLGGSFTLIAFYVLKTDAGGKAEGL